MSRSTSINETWKSVTGTFLLYDLLSITTMSGSINISIVPQPASSAKGPAELRLNTMSGSINVTMAPFLNQPPITFSERIFNSSVETMSGSITASLLHNHKTYISSMSGSKTVSLYPLSQPCSMSHIDVRSFSGSTSLTLQSHVNSPQTNLKALSAKFHGTSGILRVRFPSTWEGEVISDLGSGRVSHKWEGLRVMKDGPSFRAAKGNGSGQLKIQGTSMNVELVAEKVPGLSRAEEVGKEGQPVPVVPGTPSLRGKVEVGRHEEEMEDDDDWTIVEDEDGDQDVTRRPPPSYEETTRRWTAECQ